MYIHYFKVNINLDTTEYECTLCVKKKEMKKQKLSLASIYKLKFYSVM